MSAYDAGGTQLTWLDTPFTVTRFRDHAAQQKFPAPYTMRTLADLVRKTTAPTKAALPWLKLAAFGNVRTDKDSLRHNANVLKISGVEGDYDDGKVTATEAAAMLQHADVLAMIYTSPSHTEDFHKWRVLCPTSAELPPDRRVELLNRVNGVLSGILAPESWTLSQSYYYGSVNANPSHEVHLVDGTPIDLHDELDAGAIGKPKSEKATPTPSEPAYTAPSGARVPVTGTGSRFGLATLDGACHDIRTAPDGEKHATVNRTGYNVGGMVAAGHLVEADALASLRAALESIRPRCKDFRAAERTLKQAFDAGMAVPKEPPPPGSLEHGEQQAGRILQTFAQQRQQQQQQQQQAQPLRRADETVYGDAPDEEQPDNIDPGARLRTLLSIDTWAVMDIPEPDRLLGDLLTTTARVFLVGRTGLGKTLLGLAIAAGVASGTGFLHWKAARPGRVLYLDGEMPAELIKPRAIDALRRLGTPIPTGNLLIFGRDIETEARRICPELPPFAPLNTPEGVKFLCELLTAIGGVDLIVFDNVMSLVSGDMKDEVTWTATLPLVASLTDWRIGQLWLDHTGHNSDRQYGSSTKAWRFDAVGCMAPLEGKADPGTTAFTLSFDHPGKARRRTPTNWREFATQKITLQDDKWTSEPFASAGGGKDDLRPQAREFYKALLDALAISQTPGKTTRETWYAECVRLGLADALPPNADYHVRDKVMKPFRSHLSSLKIAGWIGVDGETVTNLKVRD